MTRTCSRACCSRSWSALGFDRSYPTLVREIRELGLRPVCECCQAGAVKLTVGLEHEPGEELQLDWLELSETPWGEKAYVLVGALSHSGRLRGCFCGGRELPAPGRGAGRRAAPAGRHAPARGGPTGWQRSSTPARTGCGPRRRRWPSTTAFRSRSARRTRPQRKGVVEKAIQYRDAVVVALGAGVDAGAGAGRPGSLVRGGVRSPPPRPEHRRQSSRPASRCWRCRSCRSRPSTARQRVVSREALVEFETNRYSVAPGHAGATVEVRARLGELHLEIYTPAGRRIARHRRALAGAGQTIRTARARPRARAGRARAVHHPQGVPAQTEPAARRAGAGRGRPPPRRAARRRGRRSGAATRGSRRWPDDDRLPAHLQPRDRPRAGHPAARRLMGPRGDPRAPRRARDRRRRPVAITLTPEQARELGFELLAAAEHADRTTTPQPKETTRDDRPHLPAAARAPRLPQAPGRRRAARRARSSTPSRASPATPSSCTTCSHVEVTATEQRRLDGRLRFASFPQHKTLEQFDFAAQPRSTAASSRSSRRCGSSRRRPTCC